MLKLISALFFFSMVPLFAQANGSVSFEEEVAPLLKGRPDLKRALADFLFDQLGSGHRISHKICPALAGRRVGSYLFRARQKINGNEVEVRFASYLRFLDASGKLVAEVYGGEWNGDENLERAVSLHEEIVAVGVNPI